MSQNVYFYPSENIGISRSLKIEAAKAGDTWVPAKAGGTSLITFEFVVLMRDEIGNFKIFETT